MRRLAAFAMLLLLLQSLGGGVAVAQVLSGESHASCSDAHGVMATESPGAGHHDGTGSGDSPGHCQMPWMTGCGPFTGCGAQALRAPVAEAGQVPPAAAHRHYRDVRAPASPVVELEAPPPRR